MKVKLMLIKFKLLPSRGRKQAYIAISENLAECAIIRTEATIKKDFETNLKTLVNARFDGSQRIVVNDVFNNTLNNMLIETAAFHEQQSAEYSQLIEYHNSQVQTIKNCINGNSNATTTESQNN